MLHSYKQKHGTLVEARPCFTLKNKNMSTRKNRNMLRSYKQKHGTLVEARPCFTLKNKNMSHS